jgi:hypothetical protein
MQPQLSLCRAGAAKSKGISGAPLGRVRPTAQVEEDKQAIIVDHIRH